VLYLRKGYCCEGGISQVSGNNGNCVNSSANAPLLLPCRQNCAEFAINRSRLRTCTERAIAPNSQCCSEGLRSKNRTNFTRAVTQSLPWPPSDLLFRVSFRRLETINTRVNRRFGLIGVNPKPRGHPKLPTRQVAPLCHHNQPKSRV
jgi:hypothetical protein